MAMELFDDLSDTFWSDNFWLPENVTWKQLITERDEGKLFIPLPRDLWITLPLALSLFIIRLAWERFVALPIGRYFGVRECPPTKATPNPLLEQAFRKYGKMPPGHDILVGLSKQVDLDTRAIERWWRRRRIQGKPSEMQRFKETSWRFLFYVTAFWYGVAVLWTKPYMWDTRECWIDYPYQHMPNDIYWYYMVELGFYFSLVLSLFMDIKRKDFLEMIIHHIATISLLLFSYSDNMVRIGSLVVVVHDAVDYWMEGAKLAKYLKFHKLCDVLFVIFTVVWFLTRICLFPLRILSSTLNEGHIIVGGKTPNVYYFYNALLLVILLLNILWFTIIVRMAYMFLTSGQVEKDERSETEPDSESEEEEEILDSKDPNINYISQTNIVDGDVVKSRANGTTTNGVQTRQRNK